MKRRGSEVGRKNKTGFLGRSLSSEAFKFVPLTVLLVVTIIFLSIYTERFLTIGNLLNVLRQISYSTILALGLGMIVLTGGMDLSLGNIAALVGIVCASSLAAGVNTYLALLYGIAVGVLCGSVNGVMISYMGIPPFLQTLAMGFVTQGVTFLWTRGYPVYEGFTPQFLFLGVGYLLDIPTPVVILLVCFLLAYVFISRTSYGRYIYALGNDENALRLCGVNVKRMKVLPYVIAGFLACVTGIVMTARMQSGQPSAAGLTMILTALTAVALGGFDLTGGEGSLIGVLMGGIFVGILNNGLVILGFGTFHQLIIIGLTLMGALSWNVVRVKR